MAEREPVMMRIASWFDPPPEPEPEPVLTASGEEVNLNDASAINAILNRRQSWQKQALAAFETCGELNYGVGQLAGAISRLRFFVADKPASKDAPPKVTSNEQAAGVIDQLGNVVDRAELQRRMTEQILLTGEPYLIYATDKKQKRKVWQVRSIEEVEASGTTVALRDAPNDTNPVPLGAGDTWIRIILPSARFASLAASPVQPILEDIDELLWWSSSARAYAQNRLAMNGALGIPQSLEVPAETQEDAKFSGATRFLHKFFKRGVTAIRQPGTAAAKLPFLFTYPDNEQRKSGLDWIDMSRASDDMLDKRTERCLQRIAQGLNLPPEVIMGVNSGSGSSHFTLQAITESLFIQHVEPLALTIVHALTVAFLRPILIKMGVANPDDYVIWYDSSNLVTKPDISQASDFGVQYLLVSPSAWRTKRGFSEEDAPTAEEEAKMLYILQQTRGRIPPGGGNDGSVNPTAPPETPDKSPTETIVPGEHPPKQQDAVTVRSKGQPAITKPIAASFSDLNGHAVFAAQLQILGDQRVRRALEHAGNRLRSRANKNANWKAAVRDVPSESVAMTLGRTACTQLGMDDIFKGAFDDVPAQVKSLVRANNLSADDTLVTRHSRVFVEGLKLIAAERLFSGCSPDVMVSDMMVIETFQLGS